MAPKTPPGSTDLDKCHIHNLTGSTLQIQHGTQKLVIEGFETLQHVVTTESRDLTLSKEDEESHYHLKLPTSIRRPTANWRKLKVTSDDGSSASFVAYHMKTSKGEERLLALPNRNMSSFLADVPDDTHLSNILLPGTHDSLALYGWPFAQCQSRPLLQQLQGGVRVIDVRLSIINNILTAYHGPINEYTLFTDVVATLYAFLRSPEGRKECVVMSIKQEDFATSSPALFSSLIHDVVFNSSFDGNLSGRGITDRTSGKAPLPAPAADAIHIASADMWYLQNRVPTLAEARGKIILFSRFGDGTGWEGGLEGTGIHPTRWPDSPSTQWDWDCKDTTFQSQDWYNIGIFTKADQKFALTTSTLIVNPTQSDPTSSTHHILPVSFSSASSIPLALPCMVAIGLGVGQIGFVGVNARISQWALSILSATTSAAERLKAVSEPLMMPQPRTENNDKKRGEVQAILAQDVNQAPPNLQRICGWLMMDFFNNPDGMVPLLVELNFVDMWLRSKSSTTSAAMETKVEDVPEKVVSPSPWRFWL